MSELFNKLHLLTQEEDLELIKKYYENGEALNEETYQTIRLKEDEVIFFVIKKRLTNWKRKSKSFKQILKVKLKVWMKRL